ncbi:MAG: hypothetical protein J6T57_00320 [Alphaproteobacteria bacterium]|nr:hypothetical protein [Alphaproteobacteria bacterium]
MKKILLGAFLALVFVCDGFAGCNSAITLMYKGNQRPADDEFLYESEYQWQASKQGWENTRHQTSGDGKGFECDQVKSASCTANEVVTMSAGHYWQGKKINQTRKYQCWGWWARGGLNDRWVVVDDGMCNSRQFGDIPVGGAYSRALTKAECSGYKKTDETHGVEFQLRCQEGRNLICWATKCDDANMKPNADGVCVGGGVVPPGPKPDNRSCREKRAGMSQTALACCDTGTEGDYDKASDKCVCKGGKTFEIVSGRGQCVVKDKPGPDPTVQCPPEETYQDGLTCKCKDRSKVYNPNTRKCEGGLVTKQCPSYSTPVGDTCKCDNEGMEYDAAGNYCKCTIADARTESGRCKCNDANKEVKNGKCEYSKSYLDVLARIEALYTSLSSTMGGFEKSVWKDAEGNFNTARLASDSIAGVVLGTAGGIITAKIVKKNQLKQGFEDIKCAIGGQNIASYGDTMTVGLQ